MRSVAAVVVVGFAWLGISAAATAPDKFKTRLSPVAMDTTMRVNIAGSGSVSAVLTGTKLAITGTFEGLKSPATVAHLHVGLGPGVRGPVAFDLTVTKAMSGTVSGEVSLSPEQIESLKKGKLYVQIHSEKAPDGNLWGWLMR